MDNTNTFKQKVKKFIDDNYGWILLISGLVMVSVVIFKGEFISELERGWNAKHREENPSVWYFSGMLMGFVFGLLFVFLIGISIGYLFYLFFFKFILKKNDTIYVLAATIWLVILYNLMWEGLLWAFTKNNAFKDNFSAINKIVPQKLILPMLKEYRENYATMTTAIIFIFIVGYGLVKNYIETTKTQAKLIAQKSQAELAALKAQINPHFLFNVLNNLYGTAIVEESPKTSEGILQLSSIMRHVVEGTKNEKIELEKEIRFLNDYIDLSKIRIPNRPNIRIETKIDWDETPTMIAPLLVIPYLENAFKYGISMNEECFIEMSYIVKNQQLEFSCRNSIIKTNDKLEVGTGTGLENTQKRLDLYYPTGYQLSTNSLEGVFTVKLSVDLNNL